MSVNAIARARQEYRRVRADPWLAQSARAIVDFPGLLLGVRGSYAGTASIAVVDQQASVIRCRIMLPHNLIQGYCAGRD